LHAWSDPASAYELLQRRTDWRHKEKAVDKALYGFTKEVGASTRRDLTDFDAGLRRGMTVSTTIYSLCIVAQMVYLRRDVVFRASVLQVPIEAEAAPLNSNRLENLESEGWLPLIPR
jgi:hypothetical protein